MHGVVVTSVSSQCELVGQSRNQGSDQFVSKQVLSVTWSMGSGYTCVISHTLPKDKDTEVSIS